MNGPSPDHLISVRHDLQPGDVGYITYMHGTLYARERGWDHTFDAYVAIPLSEFARSQSSRERIWITENEGRILGSVAIVKSSERGSTQMAATGPEHQGPGNRAKAGRRGSGFLSRGRILIRISLDGEYSYDGYKSVSVIRIQEDSRADT
jgi:hypothetical protein